MILIHPSSEGIFVVVDAGKCARKDGLAPIESSTHAAAF